MKPFVSLAGVAALLSVATPSHALIFNFTYDSSVSTQFGANFANFQAAANTAAANFTSVFNDNIHVNITLAAVAGTGTLGASNTFIPSLSYAALRTAVVNDATSTDDATAIGAGGSMVAADPKGTGTWRVSRAQAKALGLTADDAVTTDGTCTFGAGFTYDYDPSNGITAGQFDLVGVMMHEFSEVMGRIGTVGTSFNGGVDAMLFDNFSYSGSGTKGLNNGAGNFFSINGGVTNLKGFNDNSSNGGDSRDWASGTNDSFNAFSGAGTLNALTAVGIRSMDVIGYNLISATSSAPEPGTLGLVGLGSFAGLLLKRRNRTA